MTGREDVYDLKIKDLEARFFNALLDVKCWHALPTKRPTMDELVSFFETQLAAAVDHGSNV